MKYTNTQLKMQHKIKHVTRGIMRILFCIKLYSRLYNIHNQNYPSTVWLHIWATENAFKHNKCILLPQCFPFWVLAQGIKTYNKFIYGYNCVKNNFTVYYFDGVGWKPRYLYLNLIEYKYRGELSGELRRLRNHSDVMHPLEWKFILFPFFSVGL